MSNVKQIIILRKDLKMSIGKSCAQAAHASINCVLNYDKNKKNIINEWIKSGQTKIVVGVKSLKKLEDIENKIKSLNIKTFKVIDEGRTEFDGKHTVTALGIGPDYSDKMDLITRNLRLL